MEFVPFLGEYRFEFLIITEHRGGWVWEKGYQSKVIKQNLPSLLEDSVYGWVGSDITHA